MGNGGLTYVGSFARGTPVLPWLTSTVDAGTYLRIGGTKGNEDDEGNQAVFLALSMRMQHKRCCERVSSWLLCSCVCLWNLSPPLSPIGKRVSLPRPPLGWPWGSVRSESGCKAIIRVRMHRAFCPGTFSRGMAAGKLHGVLKGPRATSWSEFTMTVGTIQLAHRRNILTLFHHAHHDWQPG